MPKMTLRTMNQKAKEANIPGYDSAEAIFSYGLKCLADAQEAAIVTNPIRQQMNSIVSALDDIKTAENILREHYGIRFCAIGTHMSLLDSGIGAQVYCGIDELAHALDREASEVASDHSSPKKVFIYDWCEIYQIAESNGFLYKPAFDGDSIQYSSTYEEACDDSESATSDARYDICKDCQYAMWDHYVGYSAKECGLSSNSQCFLDGCRHACRPYHDDVEDCWTCNSYKMIEEDLT